MPESAGGEHDEPQQLELMRRLVDLSLERTRQSALRSELSAERSYMNAERTLSVWIRTALASMVVGIAVDRFGLTTSQYRPAGIGPDSVSTWVGAALVAFGVFMAIVTGARFRRYAAQYCRSHMPPAHHGPFLAPTFALFAALFGIVLFILLIAAL